ncbi:MAG: hypothetical protein L3J20_02310 [Flavobacteriaceae bacterium]|nr:hypothetical protein [Flavobacteriaceae bacterium]
METNFIEISNKVQNDTRLACTKFYKNAELYTTEINSDLLGKKIISQTDSLLFKFISVATNLEFLWQIHYIKKDKLEKQKHTAEWQNNLSLTDLMYFESVVIQLRAFIDFSQKLSCSVLEYTKPVDGTKDFYKILSKINSQKARKVESKFSEIMSENSWGSSVKSIRDKITHYDIVKTKSEFRPTIQGKSYERFCQDLENDMFVFLTELQLILFEKEWVSG